MSPRPWAHPNLLASLTSKFPPKPRFNSHLTPQTLASWQNLKESLADSISNRCSSLSNLHCLHAQALSFGLHQNLYLCAHLITKYFHLRDTQSPQKVFNALKHKPIKTLVWNSLIKGYLRSQVPRLALDVYAEMIQPSSRCVPDEQTFRLMITACTQLSEFELGLEIEERVLRKGMQSDVLIATALISMHLKTGDIGSARRVFDEMTERDVVAWNAMISGFSQSGFLLDAMRLLNDMRIVDGFLPTEATFVSVISGCGDLGSIQNGRAIHAHVIKLGLLENLNVSNSLMAMYVACSHMDSAEKLFDGMISKDSISWSVMIGGYVEHKQPHDALNFFHWISNAGILLTRPILLNVLVACADLGDYRKGEWIKERYLINKSGELISDAHLITSLIYMYAKCAQIDKALKFLDEVVLVKYDVIAWNAIIKACAEQKQHNWVLKLEFIMQWRGINPNATTFLTLLSIVSSVPVPRKGIETHCRVIKRGFESQRTITNSLIDMYARSGNINDSCKVFDSIREKDVISWSSMIKAYALNACPKEALDLFQTMRKTETRPNSITFLALLSACSHAGFIDEGKKLLESMEDKYGVYPGLKHFTCIMDMYCRAGLLKDAYCLLKDCNNVVLWGSLLSACRVHEDLVIGEKAAQNLFVLEPENPANYLMLADIYISKGQREEANGVLNLLREKGSDKRTACSWFFDGGSQKRSH